MARAKIGRARDHPGTTSVVIPTPWGPDAIQEGSLEYYRRREQEFDLTKQTQKIYKDTTESLRDWIKDLWFE